MVTIHSQETIINQAPNNNNGNIAICTAKVTLPNGQTFTGMGICATNGKDDYKLAVKNAAQEALQQAIHTAETHVQTQTTPVVPHTAPAIVPPRSKTTKLSNSGKPITDKQKQLIGTVASRNGYTIDDAEKVAMSLYDKPIAELGTKDVNPLLALLDPSSWN